MRRPPSRCLPLLMGVLLSASVAAAGPGEPATVVVDATRFQPLDVQVQPGGTVVWDVREPGHTIVADDGRFDFRGSDGTVETGSTPSHTFSDVEEVVRYHCTLHGGPGGQGMAGVVVVGSPKVERPARPVIRVPQDIASLTDAVAAAVPGDRIELAPGRYGLSRPLRVDLRDRGPLPKGLEIVGVGTGPSDVVLEVDLHPQLGPPATVLDVTGAFVTLSRLTVDAGLVSSTGSGIHLDGADQVELRDVVVDGGGFARYAILAERTNGLRLAGVAVHDARLAAVSIRDCVACGAVLQDLTATDSTVGVLLDGAGGVTIRRATVTGNAVGIVARASGTRPASVTITGSVLAGNRSREGLPGPGSADRRLATGAGIWLDGTTDALVSDNTIAGNRFGVVLSGGAWRNVVTDNDARGNTTDLAWDGLGAATCFDRNDHASSAPPLLEHHARCGGSGVGIPYPLVTAELAVAAYS